MTSEGTKQEDRRRHIDREDPYRREHRKAIAYLYEDLSSITQADGLKTEADNHRRNEYEHPCAREVKDIPRDEDEHACEAEEHEQRDTSSRLRAPERGPPCRIRPIKVRGRHLASREVVPAVASKGGRRILK